MTVVVSMLMIMTVLMRMIRMGVMGMIIPMIVRLMVVPMPMPMPVVMSVMMTMAVVVMMVVVVPLAFAERIGPHKPIQIDGAHSLLQGMDALVQHAGDLGLEAEIAGVGKADLRVLGRQIFHLPPDALDERAGEQVVRHDDDLHHAQRHLIAHHFLQAREGHTGEGQVHALVITNLPQPAGHLRHVTIGQPVAGAPAEQHEAGGVRIGHIQREHGLTQQALEDAQQRIGHAQMRGIVEFHLRMALLRPLDGFRDVVADMHREGRIVLGDDAERIGVGQRQVSKIENGDIDNAKVSTIRNYLEAVGGSMAIEYVIGDQRVQVA